MPISANEIGKELIEALGLPKYTTGFTLRCYTGKLVEVECEYLVEDGSFTSALAKFRLTHRPETTEAVESTLPSMRYDDWRAEQIELAHREFMRRTSRRLLCDIRLASFPD